MRQDEFLAKAEGVWGTTYDYSRVKYTRGRDKIIIICRQHGKFKQIAQGHLQGKVGCKECVRLDQVRIGFRQPLK